MYIFRKLADVKEKTGEWRKYYNEQRSHEALENKTPVEYKEMLLNEN